MTEIMQEHFKRGEVWEEDTYHNLKRSNRIAWFVAGGLGVLCVTLAVAVAVLAATMEIRPFVLTVDKQTGYMEVAQTVESAPLSTRQAVTDSLLAEFVQLRESYLHPIVAENYHKAQAMSEGKAAKEHNTLWDGENPNNPSTVYGYNGRIDVEILSVTPLNDTTSSVRFRRKVDFQGKVTEGTFNAVIVYRFVPEAIPNKLRLLNPLGFKVASYRVTEEFVN